MSDRSSAVSADSTTDSLGLGFDTSSSVRATLGGEKSSGITGPECPSTRTYALSENQRGELLLTDIAHQLTSGGGKPRQVYSAVVTVANTLGGRRGHDEQATYISSAEGSPAKTCPSPADAEDSPENGPAFSSSSPASSTLFDPDGFSSRTYPVSSLRTAVGTSEQSLERWPTSGTAWDGGFSTAVSSECRSAEDGCSSSEPSLTEILEPPQNVPARYSLSARAAQGILRRAEKRGRTLPSHLSAALEQVARMTTTDSPGGS